MQGDLIIWLTNDKNRLILLIRKIK